MTDCTHDIHKGDDHMMADRALKAIHGKNSICWMSAIIKKCETCGADISHARRVRVKTVKEVLRDE